MWVTGFIFILFIDKVKEPTNKWHTEYFLLHGYWNRNRNAFHRKKRLNVHQFFLFVFWSVNLQNESIFHLFQCSENQLQFCCTFFCFISCWFLPIQYWKVRSKVQYYLVEIFFILFLSSEIILISHMIKDTF